MEYKGLLKPYERLMVIHSLIHSFTRPFTIYHGTSRCQAPGMRRWKAQRSLLSGVWGCSGKAVLVQKEGGVRSHVVGSDPLREQNLDLPLLSLHRMYLAKTVTGLST